jgi:glycosyltransferase involved in cell wall biosynthesis
MANKSSVTKSAENQKPSKVVVIFPAKNEANTIKSCIEVVKQSKYEPAIIVADGHSTDKTRDIASENGAEIVMPEKRIHPGKGLAMKTGLKAALAKNPAVIVFLDSDIRNLTVEWLDKLVRSVLKERHDMARGMYLRQPRDAASSRFFPRGRSL